MPTSPPATVGTAEITFVPAEPAAALGAPAHVIWPAPFNGANVTSLITGGSTSRAANGVWRALITSHCLNMSDRPVFMACADALFVTPVKLGSATTARMASTAITTTNSISEKPACPGFRLRTRRVRGLQR